MLSSAAKSLGSERMTDAVKDFERLRRLHKVLNRRTWEHEVTMRDLEVEICAHATEAPSFGVLGLGSLGSGGV